MKGGNSLGRGRGRGDRRRATKGAEGGSNVERDRRGQRIIRARAVPSKGSLRDKLRQWKTRNSKKMHNRGLGDGLTNARHVQALRVLLEFDGEVLISILPPEGATVVQGAPDPRSWRGIP